MIYVVTASDRYYPMSGAHDWELVTRDLEGARLRAQGLRGPYRSVAIIGIDEDNLHAVEISFAP